MDPIRSRRLKSPQTCLFITTLAMSPLVTSAGAGQLWNPWPGSYDPDGGAGTPGGDGQPSPIVDGFGDAVDSFGFGPPLLDIDTITVEYDESDLHFSITFHTPISPPWTNEPDTLVGVLEFDVDQNPLTGIAPLQTAFSPPFSFLVTGNDFLLLFVPEFSAPGIVGLADAITGEVFDAVPVEFGPSSVSGSIRLSQLGGDDGVVDFTAIIGTLPQPTDAMEVVGVSVEFGKTPVPTVAAWGMSVMGLLLAAGMTVKFGRRHARNASMAGP